jgi:hypothetical protein
MCPGWLAKDLLDVYPANLAYTHYTHALAADACKIANRLPQPRASLCSSYCFDPIE